MKLQLVTFEQAKALKELGFPQTNMNNSNYEIGEFPNNKFIAALF